MNCSALPRPVTSITWPPATTLSGVAVATPGQVNGVLSTVIAAPGDQPAATRSCADRLLPLPSRFAAVGLALSLIPVLSNAAANEVNVAAATGAATARPTDEVAAIRTRARDIRCGSTKSGIPVRRCHGPSS